MTLARGQWPTDGGPAESGPAERGTAGPGRGRDPARSEAGLGRGAVWSALAVSLGTLVCCALPALLVLLGLGSAVAAAVSAAPWLAVLSRNKAWVFLAAGVLIAGSRLYAVHVAPRLAPDGAVCPVSLGRATRLAWWTSIAVYATGLFVAYLLAPLLIRLDG